MCARRRSRGGALSLSPCGRGWLAAERRDGGGVSLPEAGEADRLLARRHHVAGGELDALAGLLLELGRAANDAIDHDLALGKAARVRRDRRALRQQCVATRVGRDDVAGDEMPAWNLD